MNYMWCGLQNKVIEIHMYVHTWTQMNQKKNMNGNSNNIVS